MAQDIMRYLALTVTVTLALIICYHTRESSQLPDQSKQGRNETCGTTDDLSTRIEICAKPVMDIIEGNLKVWPKSLEDTENLCQQIHGAERCMRDESRRCAKGLHKTIVSTVANSIQRARKRECSKDKHPAILKMVNCIRAHTKDTKRVIANVVSRMSVIEKQMTDLDKKTNGICCTIKGMEVEVRELFDKICPDDTQTILRLYRAVLDDVFELICRSAKCQGDIFRGYKIPKLTSEHDGLVEITLRIIFSLGD